MINPPWQIFLDLGMTAAPAQALTYGIIAIAIVLIAVVGTWLARNILFKAVIMIMQADTMPRHCSCGFCAKAIAVMIKYIIHNIATGRIMLKEYRQGSLSIAQ